MRRAGSDHPKILIKPHGLKQYQAHHHGQVPGAFQQNAGDHKIAVGGKEGQRHHDGQFVKNRHGGFAGGGSQNFNFPDFTTCRDVACNVSTIFLTSVQDKEMEHGLARIQRIGTDNLLKNLRKSVQSVRIRVLLKRLQVIPNLGFFRMFRTARFSVWV